MIRTSETGYHLQNTNGLLIQPSLNVRSQNGSGMDNIKTDEAALFCCVRCGLAGGKQLFLKEKLRGPGRGEEWQFTFRLHSLRD